MRRTDPQQLDLFATADAPAPAACGLADSPSVVQPPHRASAVRFTTTGPAALAMCVLGSGSGGNSTVIRIGTPPVRKRPEPPHGQESGAKAPGVENETPVKNAILIDAGFGPSTIVRRLDQAG